jgi:hypothetical protein
VADEDKIAVARIEAGDNEDGRPLHPSMARQPAASNARKVRKVRKAAGAMGVRPFVTFLTFLTVLA